MAKGHKRGSREIRKPKQIKKPVEETATTTFSRGMKPTTGGGKKK
jgi:hypothetical protein